jgi:hypothetical protein
VTGPRRFEVVAWASERRLVLYVPAIEAATSVLDLRGADDLGHPDAERLRATLGAALGQ